MDISLIYINRKKLVVFLKSFNFADFLNQILTIRSRKMDTPCIRVGKIVIGFFITWKRKRKLDYNGIMNYRNIQKLTIKLYVGILIFLKISGGNHFSIWKNQCIAFSKRQLLFHLTNLVELSVPDNESVSFSLVHPV